MNSKIFKYAVISMFAVTLFVGQVSASEYINYFGIEITEEEYDNLINLGFTPDEIYHMNEENFEQNKDIESTLEVQNTKYYKTVYTDLSGNSYSTEISKEEYDNQSKTVTPRATVTTSYKTMTSSLTRNSDNTFRYKVSVSWTNIPSTRSYDIIGIGFNDEVYISSLVNFVYYYCNTSNECTTSSAFYDKKKLSTGGSAVYKVPSGSLAALTASLYYDVSKNTTATLTGLSMYGDYAHATTNVTPTLYTEHTVNNSGLQLYSSIISKYDAIPYAQSSWIGTW